MLTALSFGIFNKDPRVAPFTDVTSISEINYDGLVLSIFFQSFIIFYFQAKPTENGELCKLPYKINPYTWDMYFCNKGFCPTATSSNSKCASGQFAHVRLFDTDVYSVSLEVGTDGINEQCIIYYYYYIPKRIDIQMSIKLRKIYFDFQRISAVAPLFGMDEISIQQGFCFNESVIVTTTNVVSKSTVSIRTTESETSMTITMESPIVINYTTDKSTIISEETISSLSTAVMLSTIFNVINSSTTTMEIIADASEKTTTSKSIPTGISTSIITENIELSSIANLSHVRTTAIDQQPTSNSQTFTIILATTVPIGVSEVHNVSYE
ncbi:unnamed protein product, partial [Rotaria magnacalcarata]